MGCSNSNILSKLNPFSSFKKSSTLQILADPFEVRQKKFFESKNVSDNFLSENLNELTSKLLYTKTDFIKSNIDKVWDKNQVQLEENLITKKMLENSFYILLGENLIKEEFVIKNNDLISYFNNLISKKNLIEQSELQIILDTFNDPNIELIKQDKILNIEINLPGGSNGKTKIEDLKILNYALDTLRYDDTSYPNAIFLHLNFDNLNSDFIIDLSEAIAYNTKLTFLAIIINPLTHSLSTSKKYLYNMNPLMYRNLFKILEGVKNNKTIKHLVITSTMESKIILAPEISNLLVKKLSDDNLFGFYFGKILVTENFLKDIISSFPILTKLKYFCLDISSFNARLGDLVKSSIIKNRSIELFGLLGFKYSEDELFLLKEEIKRNFYIKLFLFKEKIDFL